MPHCNQNVIKHKLGLLHLTEEFNNDSRGSRLIGFPQDTFYSV